MKKVFTKYDQIPERIIEPSFGGLEISELDEGTNIIEGNVCVSSYVRNISKVEEGLEGIKFVDYE